MIGTIRPLVYWPNSLLRQKSKPVEPEENIEQLVADMFATMRHWGGVGLAAVQIGVLKQVLVIDSGRFAETWINSRITQRSPEKEMRSEGCLSLPGFHDNVMRHTWVEAEGFFHALNGEEDFSPSNRVRILEPLRAQILQHELEHLNGIVFVDRLDPGAKDRLRAQLRRRRH